jgi:hypothetical protein
MILWSIFSIGKQVQELLWDGVSIYTELGGKKYPFKKE